MKAALDNAPRDYMVAATAAALYSNVGELQLAEEQIARLNALSDPDRSGDLTMRVNMLRTALNYEDALDMMQKFGVSDDSEMMRATKRFLESTDKYRLSREARRELMRVAIATVRAQKCAIKQTSLDDEFGDGSVRFQIYVDETAERCGEINRAIADALCERFDDPAPEVVTFACRPASSYVFNGAFLAVN
ncbi:hypothetical protein [Burkholderia multivorans]|uniref:hypothetical protein n=1 Tax=Burkholderia multivorans TaxID=87883 RepID=UPI0011B1E8A6|nr:hypothetical protein [Burkholderia multivorans]